MIEVYEIVSGKYDSAVTPTLIISDTHENRGTIILGIDRRSSRFSAEITRDRSA